MRRQLIVSGGVSAAWVLLACGREEVLGLDIGMGGALVEPADPVQEAGGLAGQPYPRGCGQDVVGETRSGGHPHEFKVDVSDLAVQDQAVTFNLIGSGHVHGVHLAAEDLDVLRGGGVITKLSEQAVYEGLSHRHEVTLRCG